MNWESSVSLGDLISAVSILSGAVLVFFQLRSQSKRERRSDAKEVYQNLELASVELFRFETQNIEITRPLWEAGAVIPAEGTIERRALYSYLCQILNLFEMAVSFREDNIMPKDVFGSWVAWFYEVAEAPGFKELWEDVKFEYRPTIRRMMDNGIRIASEPGDQQLPTYFDFVAREFNCPIIKNWLTRS